MSAVLIFISVFKKYNDLVHLRQFSFRYTTIEMGVKHPKVHFASGKREVAKQAVERKGTDTACACLLVSDVVCVSVT